MTWTLHHGDCIEWMRSLPDKSVDHVIADPPYSEHVHANARSAQRKAPLHGGNGKAYEANKRRGISRGADFGFAHVTTNTIASVALEAARVARRWVAVFSDVESCHLWREALEGAGLDYVRTAFWHKLAGAPQFSGDRPAVACEAITLAHPRGRKRWNGGGKAGIYQVAIELNRGGNETRHHPTAKPLDLMLALVADFTDPGETILDPFCGSGTTGVAALRLGRHFLGAEMDATHHATATARLCAEESGSTLGAVRAGQLSLIEGAAE
jgi:DNA modification methylase